jgi:COX assembly protein 2
VVGDGGVSYTFRRQTSGRSGVYRAYLIQVMSGNLKDNSQHFYIVAPQRKSRCIHIYIRKITQVFNIMTDMTVNSRSLTCLACEEVMAILDECHARGFMWKAVGMCNTAKTNVNKCLRAQRLERTKLNREAAKVKREQVKGIWAEIDSNT